MNRQRIAQELVAVARELTADDPIVGIYFLEVKQNQGGDYDVDVEFETASGHPKTKRVKVQRHKIGDYLRKLTSDL